MAVCTTLSQSHFIHHFFAAATAANFHPNNCEHMKPANKSFNLLSAANNYLSAAIDSKIIVGWLHTMHTHTADVVWLKLTDNHRQSPATDQLRVFDDGNALK